MKNKEIWNKLLNFQLDLPQSELTFTSRLARENNWTQQFAQRVVLEYKKFIYLSFVTKKAMTPSEEVDQAWHMHLIYSSSYWKDMCEDILGGFKLHHGPTKGGSEESTKYQQQYTDTLRQYLEEFRENAPLDIWPDPKERFENKNYKWVSNKDNYIINKRAVLNNSIIYLIAVVGSFLVGSLASATESNARGKNEVDLSMVLLIVVCVIIGLFIIRGIYRYFTRKNRNGGSLSGDSAGTIFESFIGCGSSCGSSHSCGSSCGSGCGGCGGCGS